MADTSVDSVRPDVVPSAGGPPGATRTSGPLPDRRARRRYLITVAVLGLAALGFAFGHLAYGNPLPVGSNGFWRIANLRSTNLAVIAVVVVCQGVATVCFQTITQNRILTPSIMGFESLYTLVQTGAVFALGAVGVTAVQGLVPFVGQIVLMVGFAALLYGWLLTGRRANLHITLLVGIILGGGLGAISTFLQRLLSPSEFDVLTARLLGNLSNADAEYLPVAAPLAVAGAVTLFACSRRLDVIALGRDAALNLGVDHRRTTMALLLVIAVMMAVSTALVGPLTFLGFLVAMISYQLAGTYSHRHVLPIACLVGFVVLTGAYFVLRHVFYAEGSVGIIIEIGGGSFFLAYILKKGRL